MNRIVRISTVVCCAMFLVVATGALAGPPEYELKVETKTPPEAVSAPMREVLAAEAHTLIKDEAPGLRFWFVKSVLMPAAKDAYGPGDVASLTLVGVVEVMQEDLLDCREQVIPAGVYTLRAAKMPQDGYHMGVAPYPHFLVLQLAQHDPEPAADYSERELMERSSGERDAPHPSAFALHATSGGEETLPQVVKGNAVTERLDVALPAGNAPGGAGMLKVGVVYQAVAAH